MSLRIMKRSRAIFLLAITGLLSCVPALRGESRTWTSVSGATVEAELIERRGNDLRLRTEDGRTLSIHLDQLSAADRQFVAGLSEAEPAPRRDAPPRTAGEETWRLREAVGPELVNARGRTISSEVLEDKVVAIYFSAGWCGPCRRFTPVLMDVHRDLQRQGHPFEVLLVSSDHSERDMLRYMRDERMPWPAVPPSSDAAKALSTRFRASGIPRLVIVDADGSTIHQSARAQVVEQRARAWDAWMESREHRAGATR